MMRDDAPAGQGREGGTAFILEEDPELGHGLPADVLASARRLLHAQVLIIERHPWRPPALDPLKSYGLLLLEGLLGRRVSIGRASATELLGPGDILRPWVEPWTWNLNQPEIGWRVLNPARLAILDERVTKLIGQRPELVVSFSARLLRRLRHAHYLMAISRLRRVEDRLLATLWHLAGIWGHVTPDGVHLPLRLTHRVLGELLGAYRPSVTVAMQRLHERGEVLRTAEGYLLSGDPTSWSPGWAKQATD